MYNNKQDFVPPIGHLPNIIPGQYRRFSVFLKQSLWAAWLSFCSRAIILGGGHALKILVGRQYCMLPFCNDFQMHVVGMHHTDLLPINKILWNNCVILEASEWLLRVFYSSVDNINDVCLIRFAFRPVSNLSFTLFAVLSMKYGYINNWK